MMTKIKVAPRTAPAAAPQKKKSLLERIRDYKRLAAPEVRSREKSGQRPVTEPKVTPHNEKHFIEVAEHLSTNPG